MNKKIIPVTIVVAVYNMESMLIDVLDSVRLQKYPIQEIIIIDNKSTDNSVKVAQVYSKKHTAPPIRIVRRDRTFGISSSYNLGVRMSKTSHVVTVHSDSIIKSPYELAKLLIPFADHSVIATIPTVAHPLSVWKQYNFWQKCLFASVAGTEIPSGNGKFDCYRKDTYEKIGGYDEEQFAHEIGTEDADMYIRLRKAGRVVPTDACVIHLHGKDNNYSMKDWIQRRKFLAVSYARYLQLHAKDIQLQTLLFLIKPVMALSPLLAFLNPLFLILLFVFPFIYLPRMFTTRETLADMNIILLPFVIIYLVYYESFWFLYSYLFIKKQS